MEFSRQEYWSGLPTPSPGDLPIPGTDPQSPTLQADSLPTKQSWGEGNGNSLWYSRLENPMTEESGKLQSMGSQSRTRPSDFTLTFHFHALEKEMATPPVFLPRESQGWGSLVSCRLWGHTESDTTEAT